ncbi:MAG: hypothetical protein ACE5L7_09540, partial [Candidatus Aminicenantales bacterium]
MGHQIGGIPVPWKEKIKIDGVMVNAFEILTSQSNTEKICSVGVHNFLDYEGPIFMDSGGFLLQKISDSPIKAIDVLNLYKSSTPDLGAVLDHPINPHLSYYHCQKRWLSTSNNSCVMFEHNDEQIIVPVVHGYSEEAIIKACEQIQEKLGNIKVIAIGSLVPLIRKKVPKNRFKSTNLEVIIKCIRA